MNLRTNNEEACDRWECGARVIESCTVIVCNAAPSLSHVHDRMPVVLKPADYDLWLHGVVADRRALKALLVPYRDGLSVAMTS